MTSNGAGLPPACETESLGTSEGALESWLARVGRSQAAFAELLASGSSEQRKRGYYHTLREIGQQPLTWPETAQIVLESKEDLGPWLVTESGGWKADAVILTGSGSSLYVGECLRLSLERALAVPAQAVSGADILLFGPEALVSRGSPLVVSFARSGDSPESSGAIDVLLQLMPEARHLLITCNRNGRLAREYPDGETVKAVVLADRTCDRSLVMTSSFTNMALAGLFLGSIGEPERYVKQVNTLSEAARHVLLNHVDALAEGARRDFHNAVYLGDGGMFGAARESALKMLEMTDGRVRAFPETYLGLRHGPMAAVHPDTMVVCFLASDSRLRAYEADLIDELNRKRLGAFKVVVGEDIPGELLHPGDVAVECPGLARLGDDWTPVIYVLAGQLLGLFRCLAEGLKPDSPSAGGVINRVVETFRIHPFPAEDES